MKRLSLLVCLSFLFAFFTQHSEAQLHANANQKPLPVAGNALSSAGYSGTGSNIDVIYQKCDWTIDPTVAKKISGTVTITFVTKLAGVSAISFDLNKTSFNNASLVVKYLGSNVPFSFPASGNVNILNITLPSALPINTTASVVITYSGTPPARTGQAEGYQSNTTNSTLLNDDTKYGNFLYTLSESYEDRDWWPCKADMQDKIDAMDIWITVPNGYRAATNGSFIDSSTVAGGFRTFKYQTKYPVASYLVAIGVANYYVYDRGTVTIGGTNVPVWYFIYPNRTSYTTILSYLDKSKTHLANFSAKYGDYPFKNEKHGYYEFGWSGGMEHQSFSGMGANSLTSWSVIAHELAHQWFGDKVTFATWNHLWLAEAFASYSEALALELDPSTAPAETPASVRSSFKTDARSTTSPSTTNPMSKTEVYIPNSSITTSDVLWNSNYGSSVYQKGAMVVSMLRKLVGDTKFFQAVKNYLADPALAYKSATTDDLKNHFEAVTGYDLDPFFNHWVYGKGHADYAIQWNNNTTKIAIKILSQTRSTGATPAYFYSPVVVKVSNGLTGGSAKDTTIVIYDQNGALSYAGNGISASKATTTFAYILSFTPSTVTFDPDAETMSNGTVTKVTNATLNPLLFSALPVSIIDFKGVKTASGNQLSLLLEQTHKNTSVTAERSEDGTSFTTIGAMLKNNMSDKGTLYTYADKTFSNTHINYYRAKTIDEEGTVRYSKIISLQNNSETRDGVSIRPNTVMDVLKIFLSEGWEEMPVSLVVYNSSGMVVKQETSYATAAATLSVKNLPAGNYSLKATRPDGQATTKRFIIVH